jgi:UDP-glucose 4-epimerase
MLIDLHAAYGLSSIALRYFNASGADPDGEIGEAHDPETHLIPLVITAARDGTAIRIFGTDYETPDGTCIRDYIHVADIANAHLLALDCMLGGGQSCALNLANERGHSVKEVIATTERVTGRSIRVENAPRRPGDPPVLIGTADRARSLLGWSPARSDLEHQISDAWSWVRKHLAAAHLSHHDNRRNKVSR